MLAGSQSKLKPETLICRMGPLRRCIERHEGDVSQCVLEVAEFERTCDKRKGYMHDREGLDDPRTSGVFGDKQPV
jgi:hypothetical protein